MKGRPEPARAAAEILAERYRDADSLLLAVSTVRGEATGTSDLDLVVFGAVEDIDYARHTITGLLDDLSAPRNDPEYRAIVIALFPALASHYLYARDRWMHRRRRFRVASPRPMQL